MKKTLLLIAGLLVFCNGQGKSVLPPPKVLSEQDTLVIVDVTYRHLKNASGQLCAPYVLKPEDWPCRYITESGDCFKIAGKRYKKISAQIVKMVEEESYIHEMVEYKTTPLNQGEYTTIVKGTISLNGEEKSSYILLCQYLHKRIYVKYLIM